MNKKMYIEPKMETMVLPQDALMDDLTLSSSGSMGTVGGGSSAPARRAPVLSNDSVPVF